MDNIWINPQVLIFAPRSPFIGEREWCGSSVGRAKDWKSLCRRFDPGPHHKSPNSSVGVFWFQKEYWLWKHISRFPACRQAGIPAHTTKPPTAMSGVLVFEKKVNVKTFESVPPTRRGGPTPLEPRFYRGFFMQFALFPFQTDPLKMYTYLIFLAWFYIQQVEPNTFFRLR